MTAVRKRLVRLLKPYGAAMIGAAFLGTFTVLCNAGLLAVSAVLLSQAALVPALLDLMPLIVGVRFFGLSRAASRYCERYVTHDVTFRILRDLRVGFYKDIEPLAPANLQHHSSGKLFKQIMDNVEILKYFYLRVLAAPLVAVLVLLTGAGILFLYSPPAAWTLLVAFIGTAVLLPLYVRLRSRGLAQAQSRLSEQYHTGLLDYIHGMGDLLAADAADTYRHNLEQLLEQWSQGKARLDKLENRTTTLIQYASWIAMVLSLLFSVPLVWSGELGGDFLAMIPLTVWACFEAAMPLPLALVQYDQGMTAAAELFSLGEGIAVPSGKLSPTGQEIVFHKVGFRYDAGEAFGLRDVSFTLPQGSRTALVGTSGSGKSTIIRLLLRFWDYDSGSVTIGGRELKDLDAASVRNMLGVVDQQPYIFHSTLGDNLRIACPHADDAALQAACERAALSEFIATLPKGFDTNVGEGGWKLSGGQRQRLALARALLKNSPVLILDEATQGLDTLTTRQILQRLEGCGKTIITISHTLQGLSAMDNIILLHEGQVVEQGTHPQLAAAKGMYSRLLQTLGNPAP